MRQAQRWLWWGLVGLAVVLAATGVWLSFNYRPDSAGAAFGVKGSSTVSAMRDVHRIASQAAVAVAFALAAVVIVDRWRRWPAPAATFAVVLALSVTGFLLPWDQLALYAVTVGTSFKGMFDAAFSDQVKFVLIGSQEISKETIRTWFVVHAAVLPIALAATVVWLRRTSSTVDERTGA